MKTTPFKYYSSIRIVALLAAGLFGFESSVTAQIIEIKGVGDAKTVDAQGKALPEGEPAKKAIINAAVFAIDTALQSQSDNIRQQFQERVVGDATRVEEVRKMISNAKVETNPDTVQRMVRATISGKLDLTELKDYMNKKDKLQSAVKRTDLEMAVFFTVRRSTQVARGAAVVSEANTDSTNSETAKEGAEEASLTVDEAVNRKETTTASTDLVEKADKISWEADAQLKEPFGSGLIGQFTDKGFENVVDGSFFEVSDEMDKDITSRGQPSPKTLKQLVNEVRAEGGIEGKKIQSDPQLVKSLRLILDGMNHKITQADVGKTIAELLSEVEVENIEGGIELIVIGSLDFSIPTKDPISGMNMVEATMSGKVMMVTGSSIPRTVAALEPKSFKAIGDTQEVAKKRVLEAMAPLTADEIISKLKNNGIL
jgi:hypothetical protein